MWIIIWLFTNDVSVARVMLSCTITAFLGWDKKNHGDSGQLEVLSYKRIIRMFRLMASYQVKNVFVSLNGQRDNDWKARVGSNFGQC